METFDFRSDTVTQPTPAMRQAMAEAPVGDDVFGEDPTINRLQELAAEMMGKEAGLFVPSGTMGNLTAILTHCGRGDEAIMGNLGHTFLHEAGGVSALGGVSAYLVPNQSDGTLALNDIKNAVRDPNNPHHPLSRLVILENTQNACGGMPLTAGYTRSVADLAHQNGLLLHIDGARIFNAAAALNVPVIDLAKPADTVTFCLSKGLCAPAGSVLCGSREFIHRAVRNRKQLGGGMRQVGILAAAGIIALEQMTSRLSEDHTRAKNLAKGLSANPGLFLDTPIPASNMIYMDLAKNVDLTAKQVAALMAAEGIKIDIEGPRRFRLVTHYWISDLAVEKTIAAFAKILA
jgi:threonine aldolase